MKKIISLYLAVMLFLFPVTAFGAEFGIDVSHNNGAVDYVEVKNSNQKFVMIRLGYYNHLDTKFWDNVKAVSEAGLDFGVYLYSYAFNNSEAQIEAEFVINTLKELGGYAERFTLPVAYDLEDKQLEALGKAQVTKNMSLFCNKIQGAGFVPMVYSNQTFFNSFLDLTEAKQKGWKIWLAKWEDSPDFSSKKQVANGIYADLWQYKEGDKTAEGLDKLDQNIAYDYASLSVITPAPPAKPSVKAVALKKLTASKKAFTAKWKTADNVSGYQLQYSTSKKFTKKTTKTVTVKNKKTASKKVKKLKSKKKYYVRIRAYKTQNGKKYYSAWSKAKTVKTK